MDGVLRLPRQLALGLTAWGGARALCVCLVEIDQGRDRAGSRRWFFALLRARGSMLYLYLFCSSVYSLWLSFSLSLSLYICVCVCAKRACAGAEKIRYESKQSAQLALASTPPPPQEPLGTGEAAGLLLLGVDDLGEGDCSHGASSRMRSIWFW